MKPNDEVLISFYLEFNSFIEPTNGNLFLAKVTVIDKFKGEQYISKDKTALNKRQVKNIKVTILIVLYDEVKSLFNKEKIKTGKNSIINYYVFYNYFKCALIYYKVKLSNFILLKI